MMLTVKQKAVLVQTINVFESGSVNGNYGCLVVYADGPHKMRQITYGKAQVTEYSNLYKLVFMYTENNGCYSAALQPYLDRIGVYPLVDDGNFKSLLIKAGKYDPIMKTVQDTFFDTYYFIPAMQWAREYMFTLPLSALVIYDSFIHSGLVYYFLRSRFRESPPVFGGDEREWVRQYVNAREDWLEHHDNPELHITTYRTQLFKKEIARGNWDLSQLPIRTNGVNIYGK
jgi:chitosanase